MYCKDYLPSERVAVAEVDILCRFTAELTHLFIYCQTHIGLYLGWKNKINIQIAMLKLYFTVFVQSYFDKTDKVKNC